jgi:hypothetical protein
MKILGLTMAAGLMLVSSAVLAQDVGVTIQGNDGPTVRMRSDNDDGYRMGHRDGDAVVVRRHREVRETGSVGCKTVVIHERNDDGDSVTKRIRKCR